MVIETARFGSISVADDKIIEFREGIPGFEYLHRFVVVNTENTHPLYWMQSLDDLDIALPVINAFEILEEYSLEVRDTEVDSLQIESIEDIMILNVVVIPEDIRLMTVNLVAPIIINVRRGVGKQIVVDIHDYSVRYPIYEDIYRFLKGVESDAGALTEG